MIDLRSYDEDWTINDFEVMMIVTYYMLTLNLSIIFIYIHSNRNRELFF
jgi:hypothetical protein